MNTTAPKTPKIIVAIKGKAGAGKDTIGMHLTVQHGFQKVAFAEPLRDCVGVTFGLPFQLMSEPDLKETTLFEMQDRFRLPFRDKHSFMIACREGAIKAFNLSWSEGNTVGNLYRTKLDRFPYITPEELLDKWTSRMWEVFGPYIENSTLTTEMSPRKLLQLVGTEVGRELWKDIWIAIWGDRAAQHDRVVVTDCRFMNEAATIRTHGGTIWNVIRPLSPTATKETGHLSEQEMDRIQSDVTLINDGSMHDLWAKADAILLAGLGGGQTLTDAAALPCDDE